MPSGSKVLFESSDSNDDRDPLACYNQKNALEMIMAFKPNGRLDRKLVQGVLFHKGIVPKQRIAN